MKQIIFFSTCPEQNFKKVYTVCRTKKMFYHDFSLSVIMINHCFICGFYLIIIIEKNKKIQLKSPESSTKLIVYFFSIKVLMDD